MKNVSKCQMCDITIINEDIMLFSTFEVFYIFFYVFERVHKGELKPEKNYVDIWHFSF